MPRYGDQLHDGQDPSLVKLGDSDETVLNSLALLHSSKVLDHHHATLSMTGSTACGGTCEYDVIATITVTNRLLRLTLLMLWSAW